MQMHFRLSGASESWKTIPDKAKFTQKHALSLSFLLIVLELCSHPTPYNEAHIFVDILLYEVSFNHSSSFISFALKWE